MEFVTAKPKKTKGRINESFVLASNNKHKLIEIKAMLSDKFDDILTLKDLGIEIEIEENGKTFEQNAYIKASTYC